MFLEINLLGLVFLADYAFGGCGDCQANFMVCHSVNTFSLCVKGKPTNSVIRCPEGKVCTDNPAVCIARNRISSVVPTCVSGRLQLENEQHYRTQDKVKETTLDTTISDNATCDNEDTSPTTQSSDLSSTKAPRDATTFCSEKREIGTFSPEGDIYSKKYVVCTKSKCGFKGYEFDCGKNYFNSKISLCQREKP